MTNLGVNTLKYVAKTYFYVLTGLYIYNLPRAGGVAGCPDGRASHGGSGGRRRGRGQFSLQTG